MTIYEYRKVMEEYETGYEEAVEREEARAKEQQEFIEWQEDAIETLEQLADAWRKDHSPEDRDFFSDLYKDVYGFRPRGTIEWYGA